MLTAGRAKAKLLDSYLISMEAQAGVAWLSRTFATCLALSPESTSKGHCLYVERSGCLAASTRCGSTKPRCQFCSEGIPEPSCHASCIAFMPSFFHSIPWLHGQAEGRKRAKQPATKTILRAQALAPDRHNPAKHRRLQRAAPPNAFGRSAACTLTDSNIVRRRSATFLFRTGLWRSITNLISGTAAKL